MKTEKLPIYEELKQTSHSRLRRFTKAETKLMPGHRDAYLVRPNVCRDERRGGGWRRNVLIAR